MRKSRLQIEVESMTGTELLGMFDSLVTIYTHESNSRRGLTKKTEKEYMTVKAELLKRLS